MPNIKLVIEITLDDVNNEGFTIDQRTISKIPTGGSIEIDLRQVNASMDSMADKIDGRKALFGHKNTNRS